MKLLIILVVLLASVTSASARVVSAWECSGDNRSQLSCTNATAAFELRFSGILYVWGTGHGYNFKYFGQKGAKLNGKPCKMLPYDPKWEQDD
jgi:hypothetical protein